MPDSLIDQILDVVDGKLLAMNTALPGEVVSYDSATGKAEVRALVKLKYGDGTILTPPVISNVPIILPRTATASLTLPIAKGDQVLIIFSQWSIDRWASEGGLVESGDARHHSMSDAFAIPGAFSFKMGTTGESGTVLKDGSTKVKIDGEKVAIGNTTTELLQEIATALNDIGTSVTPSLGAPLSNSVAILASAAKIQALAGSL
ncbi:MAG: Gp138 family membrane-puncturing spike protein [Candidatus Hydrogenedentes bacterium]|nr:Gp138 family membrane-puncturing spike protein [Candidatus Hydrogenedentota bacterium]